MRFFIIILLLLGQFFSVSAQDVLVLKTGKRIAFSKLDMLENSIEVTTYEEKVTLNFSSNEVLGYCSPTREKNYYLKPNPENYGGLSYQFLERDEVGKISVYKKMNKAGDFNLYLEKGERFENAYATIATGNKKKEKLKIFSSFINDDKESVAFINAPGFKFKPKDAVKVVQYYNRRNYEPSNSEEFNALGAIFLYRTKLQKIKRVLQIQYLEETYDLKLNDYIKLELPITHASELNISGEYLKNKKLIAGNLTDQYFEVVYDRKTKTFVLDRKEGSERQYEFYKIAGNAEDK